MITIESKRKKRENILKKYPGAVIKDVTSQATDEMIKLSPFYPHAVFLCRLVKGIRRRVLRLYGRD